MGPGEPLSTVWGVVGRLVSAGAVTRPGASVPGVAAWLPFPTSDRVARPRRLRRSLRACTAEGMLAEGITACAGGAVVTAWALHLGFGPLIIGALGAIPVAAQAFHLPAAWLTQALGRRAVAIRANLAARLCWLGLVPLALLDLPLEVRQALFLGLTALSAVLSVIGNNAWVAWIGELVPGRYRGRYFGTRMAATTLAGTLAALGAGVALDRAAMSGAALAALAVVASLLGVLCAAVMGLQHDPEGEVRVARFDRAAALAPLRCPRSRALLRYQLGWNAAVGVSASFFGYHMIANLKMGFTLVALHGALVAAARMLTAPAWGRAIDRLGARPVLAACSVGIAVIPALWVFPTADALWLLAFEAMLAGCLWGGHGLAAFGLPLEVAPRRGRPYALAAFASAAGLSFGVASVAGGALAWALPDQVTVLGRPLLDLHVLFLLSSAARLIAALPLLRGQPNLIPVAAS